MKISKACNIINDLRTVYYAAVEGNPDDAKICVYDFYSPKPFVIMRVNAITWNLDGYLCRHGWKVNAAN